MSEVSERADQLETAAQLRIEYGIVMKESEPLSKTDSD
jgi:hypothetical protein